MAKPPVLGNDPFQRGAAERPAARDEAPAAKASKKPARRDAPVAAPRAEPEAPPAGPQQGATVPERPTRRTKAAPVEPRKPAARKNEPRRRAAPRAAAEGEAPASAQGAANATPPAPSASQASEPIGVEAPAPAPAPAPEAASPVLTPEPTAAREASDAEAERAPVLEGEVIDAHAARPLLARSPSAHEAPESREPDPSSQPETWIGRTSREVAGVLGGAVQVALASSLARKVTDAVGSAPLLQRALGSAAEAAAAVAPAYEVATRLLPPAVDAARTAVQAVVSGQAARELVTVAAEAGDAARRIARRTEPSFEVDAFGEDPKLSSRLEPLFDFLHDRYFRIEALGVEHVPQGPCLLVCNHSGALPLDGPMVRTVLRRECHRPDARWLVEDALFHAPFMGTLLNRLGAVRACPENAERLLADGVALAVFPEGLLGISKPVARRYQLQRFGRGGFVKLAIRAGVPIVPVAIVGAEEASPLLARIPLRSLGVPYLPVTPMVPLPTRWTVSFLPPIDLGREDPHAAEDHARVGRWTADTREAIQKELDRLLVRRRSVLSG